MVEASHRDVESTSGRLWPQVSPAEVMNGSTGSSAWPVVAAGYTAGAATFTSPGYPLLQGGAYLAWLVARDTAAGGDTSLNFITS